MIETLRQSNTEQVARIESLSEDATKAEETKKKDEERSQKLKGLLVTLKKQLAEKKGDLEDKNKEEGNFRSQVVH